MGQQPIKIVKWTLLFACVFGYWQTRAHPMPSSIVNLFVLENSIKGEAKIPLMELQSAIGETQTKNIKSLFLKHYFLEHIVAISEKKKWTTHIDSIATLDGKDPIVGNYKEILVYFELNTADKKNLRSFTFNYDAVVHQVVTHKILVYIQQDWYNGIQDEKKAKQIGIIELNIPKGIILPLEVNLQKGSWWTGFKGMLTLGMEHIKEGTDHLLFLLVLLLPATLTLNGKRWGGFGGIKHSIIKLLKVVTAFTIGHSITLLIGALGWLHLPSQPVEVLIAISILVSSVNAIRPIFYGKEMYVAAGFGLIHGLAFATVLSNLSLDKSTMTLSILGFNIGIEIMQIFAIISIVPLIILLSQTELYKWIRVIWAVLAGLAALSWIMERLSGKPNKISILIQKMIVFTPSEILLFALFTLIILALHYKRRNTLNQSQNI